MTTISNDTLTHLAALSCLELSETERVSLKTDLNSILQYVKKLDDLNTTNIPPTFQVTGLKNVWRPDEIMPQDATPDELLALSRGLTQHQIKVPKVL